MAGVTIGLALEKRRYRTADLVIAISEPTRRDACSFLGVARTHRSHLQWRRHRALVCFAVAGKAEVLRRFNVDDAFRALRRRRAIGTRTSKACCEVFWLPRPGRRGGSRVGRPARPRAHCVGDRDGKRARCHQGIAVLGRGERRRACHSLSRRARLHSRFALRGVWPPGGRSHGLRVPGRDHAWRIAGRGGRRRSADGRCR